MVKTLTRIFLINITGMLAIIILNTTTGIIEHKDVFYFLLYVGAVGMFAAITIWFYVRQSYKWNAVLYAIIGIVATIGGDRGNAIGALFLCLSFFIHSTIYTSITVLGLTCAALVAKAFMLDMSLLQTLNLWLLYAGAFVLYFTIIHPKGPKVINVLDKASQDILQYLASGATIKDIGIREGLTTDAVSKRIQRLRQKYHAQTNAELVYRGIENGILRPD